MDIGWREAIRSYQLLTNNLKPEGAAQTQKQTLIKWICEIVSIYFSFLLVQISFSFISDSRSLVALFRESFFALGTSMRWRHSPPPSPLPVNDQFMFLFYIHTFSNFRSNKINLARQWYLYVVARMLQESWVSRNGKQQRELTSPTHVHALIPG